MVQKIMLNLWSKILCLTYGPKDYAVPKYEMAFPKYEMAFREKSKWIHYSSVAPGCQLLAVCCLVLSALKS